MWRLKTVTVPVVIGTLGVVKEGIEKNIDKIPGKINITEFQKITLLWTKPHSPKGPIDRMTTK